MSSTGFDGAISPLRLHTAVAAILLLGTVIFSHFEPLQCPTLLDSFYFTAIVLTTIGFGDIIPLTPEGRLATVVLTILGAGLFSIYVSEVGRWRKAGVSGIAWDIVLLVQSLVLGVFLSLYLDDEKLPRTVYDAVYFAAATGTTLGFGDFHPSTPLAKVLVLVYAIYSLHVWAVVIGHVGNAVRPLLVVKEEAGAKPKGGKKKKTA
eukprot:comp16689_c0_seq1/m.14929 comp16689_c0_seq1/g.14929  ORF comp16689_c0_seq1/g.14929 comp16689_c0_seq1/m.14929 type:complete len:206 (-) comp16689_c0_seq1:799-1416(-)